MTAQKREIKELIPQMVVNYSSKGQPKDLTQELRISDPAQEQSSENTNPRRNFISVLWNEAEKLVELTLEKKGRESKLNSIFIKANDQIINLKLSDVLWVEAYGDYVNFITEKARYLVHSTMKAIESKLPVEQFVRIHRSFIIRPDKIDLIEESLVQIGKKLIPIGESYRQNFMSRLNLI